ncbi:MAG: Response regulator PleD [Syntrophus sp. PtaB.Bin138]|nr:MAG: Response regulator PleD [Syntrophus sp. PtaB.Bin138]
MKVLIAEDDSTSRRILTAILKKWGYDPVVTEDGQAAWDILKQADAPKLLLLDWNMPKMEGPEICRLLRQERTSDPPYVILLTSRDEKGDIVLGLDAGANDYIVKPYDPKELQARIRVGGRMIELQASLAKAYAELSHQATHDPLTGVLNRRAVLMRLSEELERAKREKGRLSIGMCDLDHFKKINDTHGHLVGDNVLTAFTRCIEGQLRPYDSFGRYGGEEFLVISTASGKESDGQLYERLCKRVAANRISGPSGPVPVTVSIGVAEATEQSCVDGLLRAADAALYRAKAEGRNRVAYAHGSKADQAGDGASELQRKSADIRQVCAAEVAGA